MPAVCPGLWAAISGGVDEGGSELPEPLFQAALSHPAARWRRRLALCQGWDRPLGKFSQSLRSGASPAEAQLPPAGAAPGHCPHRTRPRGASLRARLQCVALPLSSRPGAGPGALERLPSGCVIGRLLCAPWQGVEPETFLVCGAMLRPTEPPSLG